MKSLRFGAIAGTAFIAICAGAYAAQPTPPPKASHSSTEQAVPATRGQLRAYVDPQTGKLIDRPVTEEQKRAAQQAMRVPEPVVQTIHHPDGSTEDVLNGAANAEMIATIGKDGKVHVQCTEAAHEHLLEKAGARAEQRNER